MMKALNISKTIVRILIGLMFITSAILKLISLDTFEVYVYSFHIFNFFMAELAARGLIILELMMGFLLILKVDYKWIWRLALVVTIGFTLFLVYVALFRNDENCHCFGDLIEVKPIPSIIKNIVIILLLFFIRKNGKQRLAIRKVLNEETGISKRRFVFTDDDYSCRFKKWCYGILFLAAVVPTCILLPPNNIYNAIFHKSNNVVEDVYNNAYQDSSFYFKIADVQYDETLDTVTFVTDTCRLDIDKGNYLVAVMSAGCQYCKHSCGLVNGMFERNGISSDKFKILIWGLADKQFAHFMIETKTWQYEFRKISPYLAIDMVNGAFPTFLFVKDGKIEYATNYRGLSENKLVEFLNEE